MWYLTAFWYCLPLEVQCVRAFEFTHQTSSPHNFFAACTNGMSSAAREDTSKKFPICTNHPNVCETPNLSQMWQALPLPKRGSRIGATFPSAESERLIFVASLSVSFVAPVFDWRSEPAKSTMFSFPTRMCSPSAISIVMVKMEWLRELSAFMSVEPVDRLRWPAAITCSDTGVATVICHYFCTEFVYRHFTGTSALLHIRGKAYELFACKST